MTKVEGDGGCAMSGKVDILDCDDLGLYLEDNCVAQAREEAAMESWPRVF